MKLRDGYGRSWLCAGYMLDCLSRRVVRARFDGDHNGPLCASASASAPRPAPARVAGAASRSGVRLVRKLRFCGYTIGADCDTTQATRPVPCVTVSITEMGLDCRYDGRWHMNIVILTETPYKYPSLTGDMLFRLWKAAIKDDDTLANEVIGGIYDGMMAFDRERAEDVMDLTVRRHPTSRDALRALLKDMQVFRS